MARTAGQGLGRGSAAIVGGEALFWYPARVVQPGDHVAGYEIVARLASGGMAGVYLGKREGAGGFAKHVAIKIVHAHLAEDPTFIEMFLDEARLSARIEHPSVVHVHDLGESDDTYFMVMEYIAGCSLAQLLKALASRKLRLSPEAAVSIAMRVAAGLHAAHELLDDAGKNLGVVHRDVSPHNVLLAWRGHVKLIDFGIAKAAERSQQTQGAMLKGKVRYMAPEQAFGRDVDRRTDVYALGIVLYEMLTSSRLFDGDSDLAVLEQVRDPRVRPPSSVTSGIPPGLDAVVMMTLAKDPALRPATAEEFRKRLASTLPSALSVDAAQIADLLGAMMQDVLAQDTKRLSGTISGVSVLLSAPKPSANADEVVRKLAQPLRPVAPPGGTPSSTSLPITRPLPPPPSGLLTARPSMPRAPHAAALARADATPAPNETSGIVAAGSAPSVTPTPAPLAVSTPAGALPPPPVLLEPMGGPHEGTPTPSPLSAPIEVHIELDPPAGPAARPRRGMSAALAALGVLLLGGAAVALVVTRPWEALGARPAATDVSPATPDAPGDEVPTGSEQVADEAPETPLAEDDVETDAPLDFDDGIDEAAMEAEFDRMIAEAEAAAAAAGAPPPPRPPRPRTGRPRGDMAPATDTPSMAPSSRGTTIVDGVPITSDVEF